MFMALYKQQSFNNLINQYQIIILSKHQMNFEKKKQQMHLIETKIMNSN